MATCNDIINRKISKSTLNFDECSVAAHFYFNFKISFYFTFLCIFLLSFEHKRQIEVFRNTKYYYVSFIIHSGTTNFKHISFEETFKFINFQQYINNNTILHFIGIIIIKTFNFIWLKLTVTKFFSMILCWDLIWSLISNTEHIEPGPVWHPHYGPGSWTQ